MGLGREFFILHSTFFIQKRNMNNVFVYCEIEGTQVQEVSQELLTKGRKLANQLNVELHAVVAGTGIKDKVEEQILPYGVDKLFVFDGEGLFPYTSAPHTDILVNLFKEEEPQICLMGATVIGRDLGPRVSSSLFSGLTADCTVLDISQNSDLDQIRPAYGGNIMAHINTPRHRPQFATVRYKIFPIPAKITPHGTICNCTLPPEKLISAITITAMKEKSREQGIEEAEVLVVAGRGVRKADDLAMLENLAALLNGKLASTRALVEAGWIDAKKQIGLSGRTVKPKLIITCGVSGAIQFVAGMNGAENIIAINSDPNAQIFKVAHIGICGDLYTIIPGLIDRIKNQSQEV